MTNTRTTDVEATVAQIKSLERVGADIVRVLSQLWMPPKPLKSLNSK